MKLLLKHIFLIIVGLFIVQSVCFAEIWIPVQATNGKSVELNLNSIEKQDNVIRYDLKQNKQDKIIINRLETDFVHKQTAILNESIYKSDEDTYTLSKRIGFEDYSKQKKYYEIKEGTLNEALYNFMILSIDTPTLDSSINWEKYFNKQQKKMQKYWHPNTMLCKHYPKERAIAFVTLVVNKNGDIEYRGYQNLTNTRSKYNDFNNRFEQEIDKVFQKVPKFKPLPKEYKGDKVVLIIKFEYSYKYDAKMEQITFNDIGYGSLIMGKNYSNLATIGQLLILPLIIPYSLFIEPFIK